MKNLGKILAVVAVVGGLAYVASSAGGKGDVVAEGAYENKGQMAYWEIREKDGINTAYIKFPGNDWTEIATQGTLQALGQVIDARMRENGYLPPTGIDQGGGGSSMSSQSNAQQANVAG